MIRIQKNQTHEISDTADLGIVNWQFPKTSFMVTETDRAYRITTDSLVVTYVPRLNLVEGGISVSYRNFRLNMLAEKDTVNLGGVVDALDNCKGNLHYHEQNDVGSACEPHPIPDGILSQRGFTVLKHTVDTLYLYNEGEVWNDLVVLGYGTNYKQAFADFYQLAGKIPMLPKWALGFIYSRWKDYDENDYRKIVARFRKEQIPLDAIILDMCWHIDYWYGFRYDSTHFSNMRAFHAWTDSVHLKTGFNHHAGALYYKDPLVHEFCVNAGINYDSALTAGLPWEPDKKIIRYDPTNRKQFSTFYEIYLAHLMKDGLDFHWVDGESSIYSSDLYQQYTTDFTGKRAVVMNRLHKNVLCNHRYPFGFSGDTYVSWETMAYSLEANIKGGNGGVYWSHDIGGYMPQGPTGYPPSAEIFARWLQLGAVSPIFRVHAKKDLYWTPPCLPGSFDQGSRLPWEWGDTVLSSARISIQLRSKLMPYIYTMVRLAHETGLPLCRGLYIDYPSSAQAYRYDEFMFGDNMLAAPILSSSQSSTKGLTERTLWLPDGDWYDYFTQTKYAGNQKITVKKSLFEFPLFVKAGSIIPMASYAEYSTAPLDTLVLLVYTSEKSGKNIFRLYEDDGESFAFQNGRYRWTEIRCEYQNNAVQKITIQKPEGMFPQSIDKRAYKICIIGAIKPTHVIVNGKKLSSWTWDSIKKSIYITVPTSRVDENLVIEEDY
ncbi:MAG TPA: TIM-barrel domain-containing protein [Bacteroidota bacterium]|nr:TIM-barrel domain-containing protein [Bacteroidota bacterium]